MKGVVFTEFIEMVEDKFGFDVSDKIITESDLPSGGAYTAVGTYDFQEMVQLVSNLSKETGLDLPTLLYTFGDHLFGRFFSIYPHFFENKNDTFDFLNNLEDYIHVEVKKLYPDAQLPTIDCTTSEDGKTMTMIYKSQRRMGDLALGLINGCITHFEQNIGVEKTSEADGGSEVTFTLTKN
ncbi:MAG: heme NO-binding domain-containing protein [Mameliella sp.]|nr:heme NO-binding domain-containing protein [Phaeodactylibacter sp.]NRA50416.1 heme NO-binding domain-containing protein [Phaeodactylibacter sp.]